MIAPIAIKELSTWSDFDYLMLHGWKIILIIWKILTQLCELKDNGDNNNQRWRTDTIIVKSVIILWLIIIKLIVTFDYMILIISFTLWLLIISFISWFQFNRNWLLREENFQGIKWNYSLAVRFRASKGQYLFTHNSILDHILV